MIHPIPSGTRDALPDETRELRLISEALRRTFADHGYGEISTPALEYESVLGRADMADARPAYRLFDESGSVFVLRSDMTVPIARVVATRYPTAELPLRFCYFAYCYRGVRPQRGQQRELLQAGIELIGSPSPGGTAEAVTVLCKALDATGLKGYRVGMGDASLLPSLMANLDVTPQLRPKLLEALARRNFVDLEHLLDSSGLPQQAAAMLLAITQRRGGPEVLAEVPAPAADAVAGMRMVHDLLDPAVAARIIFDLGLVRSIGYYTGAVFEVYDPTLGAPIGGGGRYDELLGRFGRSLPAVGFALGVERLHIALAGEERGSGASLDSLRDNSRPQGQRAADTDAAAREHPRGGQPVGEAGTP
jgi:ATP phosphoribosyltransferase regulatory subunit